MPKQREAFLITHTHWDREWYLSCEEYRFRLVRAMERVMDIVEQERGYHSFWLDGQTLALDDYLEVRPEARGRLMALLKQGRILVGPWYLQPDEMMPDGESSVRNLLLGCEAMRAVGQDNRIGYLADNFGHPSQMPQILRGFGIDNAIFWRGYRETDMDGAEQTWTAPDGSTVIAVCLVRGYSNAASLHAVQSPRKDSADPLEGQPQRLVDNLAVLRRFHRRGPLLLMNGIDHAMPTADVAGHVRKLNELYPDLHVRHGSLEEYLAGLRSRRLPTKHLRGELGFCPGLSSTGSARIRQKLAHWNVESRLLHYAEPLMAAAQVGGKAPAPGFLKRAWKLVLQNQFHDAISGAHSDNVADDVANRFRRAGEIAQGIVRESLDALTGCVAEECARERQSAAVLFNPCGWERAGVVELDLAVPRDTEFDHVVVRRAGKDCPVQLLSVQPEERLRFLDHMIPARENILRVRLLCDVGMQRPFGLEPLSIESVPGVSSAPAQGTLSPEWGVLDNGVLRVRVHPDASLDIRDGRSGMEMRGTHQWVDEPDAGNQYESFRVRDARRFRAAGGTVEQGECGPLGARYTVRTCVPTASGTVPICVTFQLRKGEEFVRVRAEIDNRCRNHRLSLAFPLPAGCRMTWAHTPFDVVERKNGRPEVARCGSGERGLPYVEQDGALKTLSFVAAPGRRGALTFVGRGLYEYRRPHDGLLQVTLLRAVGTVASKFSMYPAEEGQTLGPVTLDYAVGVAEPSRPADVLCRALTYQLEPMAHQVDHTDLAPCSLCAVSRPDWILSSIKPAQAGAGTVVRLFSLAPAAATGRIEFGLPFRKATLVRLDETPLRALPRKGRTVVLRLKPRQIASVLLV